MEDLNKILHSAYEEVPVNTYIYVFRKHKDHNTPAMSIMRFFSKCKIAEVEDGDNMLPIAWCKASDMLNLLGMSQGKINELTKEAKALAWCWYKE